MKKLPESKVAKRIFLTVFAMAVVVLSFVLSGKKAMAAEDDIVYIPDANFKALLNKELGVDDPTADITEGQLASISSLTISQSDNIKNITSIKYLTNLKTLKLDGEYNNYFELDSYFVYNLSLLSSIENIFLSYVNITSLSCLDKCENIKMLDVKNCDNLTNIAGISKLDSLEELCIEFCDNLTDISEISKADSLRILTIRSFSGSLTDISALKDKLSLEILFLEGINITKDNKDIYMNTISSLVNLSSLTISDCGISDEHTSMLAPLSKLERLNLAYNNISKIDFLLNHKDVLESLSINNNKLTNDATKIFQQMQKLWYLIINNNNITDFSFLSDMPETFMYSYGIKFTVSNNVYIACENESSTSTYVIENDIKDAKGNYVTPIESEYFTYNEETKDITINFENIDYCSIKYVFDVEYSNGKTTTVEYIKYIRLITVGQIGTVTSYLEDTATLYTKDSSELEYQWYKDEEIIEDATDYMLTIDSVSLDDAGSYKAVVKGDYGTVVSYGNLVVKPYKLHTGKLEMSGLGDGMVVYRGDEITYTVEVLDGSGDFRYSYAIKDVDGSITLYASDENTYTRKIPTTVDSGSVEIYVTIYDRDSGKTVNTNTVYITLYDKLEAGLKLNGSQEDIKSFVGSSFNLEASAQGGLEGYTYKYVVEDIDTGDTYTLKDYSESTSYSGKYSIPGNKKFTVYVKDALGREAVSNSVTVNVINHLLTIDGVSDKTIRYIGEEFTLNIENGAPDSYTYKYVIENLKTGETFTFQDYSDKTQCKSIFTVTGKKKIVAYVKDAQGNVVETNSVTVCVYDKPLAATLTVSGVSDNMAVYNGDTITCTVSAEGGSGVYTYYMYYTKNSGGYYLDYFSDNVIDIKTDMYGYTGDVMLYFKVGDSDGNKITTNTVDIKVYDKLEAGLKVNGSQEDIKSYVGDSFNLEATVQGGCEGYTYKYVVEDADTGETYTLKDYSESASYSGKYSKAGNKKFTVYVKDALGREAVSNSVTVTVYDELTIRLAVSAKEFEIGYSILLIPVAKGGSGEYTYKFIEYNVDTNKWIIIADNITSNQSWKPSDAGEKILYVEVTDSAGKTLRSAGINVKVFRKPGLYKASDGNWYYLTKEKIDTSMTGLAKNAYGWWYVSEGKLDLTYTGTATNDYGIWYVTKGKLDLTYTGMAKDSSLGWIYLTNGKYDTTYTGMAKNKYGWWYIKEGKLDLTYTGMAKNKYGWWYIKEGKLDLTYTGMAENQYGIWYMNKGKLDTSVTGLVKTNIGWIYLTKGKLDTSVTGLVKNSKGWWYVKEGKLDWTYTGLATNKYGTWYVKKGMLDTSVNGMTKVDATWIYLVNGKLDTTYTGMAQNKYGWWQMTKGVLDLTYTGISTNQYGMWYMTNGKLDLTYTGKAAYGGVIYNVVKGKVVK